MSFVVTGVGGQLGSAVWAALLQRQEPALGVASLSGPRPEHGRTVRLDLADRVSLRDCLVGARPRIIVHAAAVTTVATAHSDPERAHALNAVLTGDLAELAAELDARLVYVSTDMVFDGESAPYREGDRAEPLSVYGRTKLAGERNALAYERALVVRLPLMYGVPRVPRPTTFLAQVAALRGGQPLTLFTDETRTPLWLEDAAAALLRAAESDCTGVLHVGGPERLSRFEMGRRLAAALGVEALALGPARRCDVPAPEPRARDLSLDSSCYVRAFGAEPGRPMAEALALMRL